MYSPLVMELIVFSGRWSNNEDGAEGERSVGGWLGCVMALSLSCAGWISNILVCPVVRW